MNPYIANTKEDVEEMFSSLGIKSFDELFVDIKPAHRPKSFHLPEAMLSYHLRLDNSRKKSSITLLFLFDI